MQYSASIQPPVRFLFFSFLLFLLVACDRPPPPLPLETVSEPPDLAQLDLAVRRQFNGFWSSLQEAKQLPDKERERRARAWGGMGQWFHAYTYNDSASRCYRNAQVLDPGDARWPYYLGMLAEEVGQLDQAIAHYQQSDGLAPDVLASKSRIADLSLQKRDLVTARQLFTDLLVNQPDNQAALFGLARIDLMEGDPRSAVEPLERLAKLQPRAVQVRYSLATAWRQLGDEQKAAEHLKDVPEDNLDQVRLAMDDPWEREMKRLDIGARNLTRSGVQAFRRGDYMRAAMLFGAAVEGDPDSAGMRVNYAHVLRQLGRHDAALEQLDEALRLASDDLEMAVKAHVAYGRIMLLKRRPERASEHLEAALTLDPKSAQAHIELGRLRHLQGRFDSAREHYASVRAFDRSQMDVRFWHAVMLILSDHPREAVSAIEEDIRDLGDAPQLRLLLARILVTARDDELRDIARARQLVDSVDEMPDIFYIETAAMVAAGEGDFAASRELQQSAIDALEHVQTRSVLHTAQRRLALYRQNQLPENAWERRERLILASDTEETLAEE